METGVYHLVRKSATQKRCRRGAWMALFGTCEWTGVRLSTLLDEVAARRSATWFLAEGQDGAGKMP